MIPPGPWKARLYSYGITGTPGGEMSCWVLNVCSFPTLGALLVGLTQSESPVARNSE
jgi:hypothetical protein